MADAGIALHVLQEILGHQSIETTKAHLHYDHRPLAEAAAMPSATLLADRDHDVCPGQIDHTSMETTRGYPHLDDRHLASAAERASAFPSPSGQRRHARQSTPWRVGA